MKLHEAAAWFAFGAALVMFVDMSSTEGRLDKLEGRDTYECQVEDEVPLVLGEDSYGLEAGTILCVHVEDVFTEEGG